MALVDVLTRVLLAKIALTKEETRGDLHQQWTHNLQSRSLWHRLDDRRTANELREARAQTIVVLIRVFLSESVLFSSGNGIDGVFCMCVLHQFWIVVLHPRTMSRYHTYMDDGTPLVTPLYEI